MSNEALRQQAISDPVEFLNTLQLRAVICDCMEPSIEETDVGVTMMIAPDETCEMCKGSGVLFVDTNATSESN